MLCCTSFAAFTFGLNWFNAILYSDESACIASEIETIGSASKSDKVLTGWIENDDVSGCIVSQIELKTTACAELEVVTGWFLSDIETVDSLFKSTNIYML